MKENKKNRECKKPTVMLRKDRKQEKRNSKKRQATERKEENEVENETRMEKAQGKRYPEDPLCHNCSKRTKDAKNSGNVASHSET